MNIMKVECHVPKAALSAERLEQGKTKAGAVLNFLQRILGHRSRIMIQRTMDTTQRDLSRLLGRLEQKLLSSATPTAELRALRRSSYERSKVNAVCYSNQDGMRYS